MATRPTASSAADLAARIYFEISYRLLEGSPEGRRLLESTASGGPAVHGYLSEADLEALVRHLGRLDGRRVLDLGAGRGAVALEVHRRTGASVTGIDISGRAVRAASDRILAAGASGMVEVRHGSISDPPRVGAAHAMALDSLMFVRDPASAVAGIATAATAGGTLFATVLFLGVDAPGRVTRWFGGPGRRLVAADDVTPALLERSRARSRAARAVVRSRGASLRGRAAAALVMAEEAAVVRLASAGLASRWRVVVAFDDGSAV